MINRIWLSCRVSLHIAKEYGVGHLLRVWRHQLFRPVTVLVSTRPLAIIKTSWILPLILAVSVLVGIYQIHTENAVTLSLRIGGIVVALALLCLSAGLAFLNPAIWRSGAGVWWRAVIRAAAFSLLAAAVASVFPRDQVLYALIAMTAIWVTSAGLVEYLIDCLLWQRKHRTGNPQLGVDRLSLTDTEARIVAAHEAGHLLMYGLLSRLPEDAFAMLDLQPNYDFAGFVSAMQGISAIEMSAPLLAWHTMLSFGGAAAEEVVFGRHSEGANADFDMAETYLRRQVSIEPALAYIRSPNCPEEHAFNAQAIVALRSALFGRTREFLKVNKDSLIVVADHLARHNSMDCEEFHPIWQTLLVPSDQKRIAPPSTIACL